jgi:hypothetical protein
LSSQEEFYPPKSDFVKQDTLIICCEVRHKTSKQQKPGIFARLSDIFGASKKGNEEEN